DDVHASERLTRALHKLLGGFGAADCSYFCNGLAASSRYGVNHLVRTRIVNVIDHDARSCRCQRLDVRPSKTTSRASNNSYLARYVAIAQDELLIVCGIGPRVLETHTPIKVVTYHV